MKQLLVLSGKGGTGKTTVSTALIQLSGSKVFADCDVDAPNLHLTNVVDGYPVVTDFMGMPKAMICSSLCIGCGVCSDICSFGAVGQSESIMKVDQSLCEGCGLCRALCPAGAISMIEAKAGDLMLYSKDQYFSTAKLEMGSGNSGKLVSQVKKQLEGCDGREQLTIIDGSPGIGCPVIASVSGADMVLIVTEPTLSGISDMERILATVKHFGVDRAVCINKSDINSALSEKIRRQCASQGIPFVGEIPFDPEVPKYLNAGKNIMNQPSAARDALIEIYDKVTALLVKVD